MRWALLLMPALLASFALSVFATYTAPTANFFMLPTRAWELLLARCWLLPSSLQRGGASQRRPGGGRPRTDRVRGRLFQRRHADPRRRRTCSPAWVRPS
jgi:peptidoglycan/LPS O-acetylase OafA/YrhL